MGFGANSEQPYKCSVICISDFYLSSCTILTVCLFIVGKGEIPSTEGTTQSDPLAMAIYALAVVLLIRSLRTMVL